MRMPELVVDRLASFAVETEFKDLPKATVDMAKTVLIDTLGCTLGGYHGDASQIAIRLVEMLEGKKESTIVGRGKTCSPNAALANAVMARYLDFNDVWISHSREVVHASEVVIPTALAVGEREHASGRDILLAIVLGYEMDMRLAEAPLNGFDERGFMIWGTPLGAAVVAGKLLNLSRDQMINAMAISPPKIDIGGMQHFRGAVTMMKSIGGGLTARDGIVAALMAKDGCVAAPAIFEGASGFCDWAGGCNFDALYGNLGKKFKIHETWLKPYSSHYSFHTALDIAIKMLKERELSPDEIKEVNVRTFLRASQMATPAHYAPPTMELAQFSLPFCMALAIAKGDVLPHFFTEKNMKDHTLLGLARKVKVSLDPELDNIALTRGRMARPASIEVVTTKGDAYKEQSEYPTGHYPQKPFPKDRLELKYTMLASKLMRKEQIKKTIDIINRFEKIADVNELMKVYPRQSKP